MKNLSKAKYSVPLLATVIFTLILISGAANLTSTKSAYEMLLSSTVLQAVVFVLPCVFYAMLKKLPQVDTASLRPFTPSRIVLIVSLLAVMLTGSWLINLLQLSLWGDSTVMDNTAATFREIGGRGGQLLTVSAVCIMPAICEEYAFRGIIMGDLRRYGAMPAIVAGALLFSMAHFSFSGFASSLFCGIVLGASVVVTRSVFASMLLHALYNVCTVFILPYIQKITFEPLGTLFTVFICAGVFLLFLVISLSEAQAIYHEYARSRDREKDFENQELPTAAEGFFTAMINPSFLLCTVFFIVMTFIT